MSSDIADLKRCFENYHNAIRQTRENIEEKWPNGAPYDKGYGEGVLYTVGMIIHELEALLHLLRIAQKEKG